MTRSAPGEPWWRGGACYQVYVRSFADSDGDGTGDARGTARLPHLVSLGVDAVWLTPFYPSPMADGGYDVADHRDVDPVLGTNERRLRRHPRGTRGRTGRSVHRSYLPRACQRPMQQSPRAGPQARRHLRRGRQLLRGDIRPLVQPVRRCHLVCRPDIDIDHVVPLAEAWRSGASSWTTSRRQSFANDLTRPQLIAVTDNVNQAKGDQDPSTWQPPLSSYRCTYSKMWIIVKYSWGLTLQSSEKSALQRMLNTCSS